LGGCWDDETVQIDLSLVDSSIQELVFVVTIQKQIPENKILGKSETFIRIYDKATETEITKYELEEDFSTETAIEFGKLYRKDGDGDSKHYSGYKQACRSL